VAKKHSKRFPLLIYLPIGRRWGNLGLLLAICSALLWWQAPRLSISSLMRPLALFPVLAGLVLMMYGLLARKMPAVRCFRNCVRIQTPIYPLVISYRRVVETRPMQVSKVFDPNRDKRARRNWPLRYWAMTAVVLELKAFPMSGRWLRLWFDPYLFLPDGIGLVLLVEDWMGLSRQLDSATSAYQSRRKV